MRRKSASSPMRTATSIPPPFDQVDEAVAQAQVDRQLRVACPEARQRRREQVHAERHGGCDLQGPGGLGPCRRGRLLDLLGLAQQPQRPLVQVVSLGREQQRPRRAAEQPQPEPLLQLLDASADRRGRYP